MSFGIVAVVLLVTLAGGWALARALVPPLADSRDGVFALAIVRALIATAVALVGLETAQTIHELGRDTDEIGGGAADGDIVKSGLEVVLFDAGLFLALATGIYLLAPAADDEVEAAEQPVPATRE